MQASSVALLLPRRSGSAFSLTHSGPLHFSSLTTRSLISSRSLLYSPSFYTLNFHTSSFRRLSSPTSSLAACPLSLRQNPYPLTSHGLLFSSSLLPPASFYRPSLPRRHLHPLLLGAIRLGHMGMNFTAVRYPDKFLAFRNTLLYDKRIRLSFLFLLAALLAYYHAHLEEVPISGRRRFNDVSDSMLKEAADADYKQLLKQYENHTYAQDHALTKRVKAIATKIIKASGIEEIQSLQWEFHVVKADNVANAFVLPNGKVFVFTGMLNVTETDDMLAGILGHEIAHVVAHHMAENLSRVHWFLAGYLLLQFLVVAAPFHWADAAASYTRLPFSRQCESEADQIGLILMARACYDPRSVTDVWLALAKENPEATKLDEWLSTHPLPATRVQKIQSWAPEALAAQPPSCRTSGVAAASKYYAEQLVPRKVWTSWPYPWPPAKNKTKNEKWPFLREEGEE